MPRHWPVIVRRLALTAALVGLPRVGIRAADEVDTAFFEQKIRPVLVERCYACHSAAADQAGRLKAGLLVDTRAGLLAGGESGPAVVPGSPDESLLLDAIRYDGLEMPPDGKLPSAVVADFERWIAGGAPDPREGAAAPARRGLSIEEGRTFWSLVPPRDAPPPAVRRADWPRHTLDHFVLARQESEGLEPLPDADPRTLVRRLYFDLIGLPPSADEVEAFVAACGPTAPPGGSTSPTQTVGGGRDGRFEAAYAALVDRLLASPHFGERWGRHWLDVARYADSNGRERNMLFYHAWRYRNYVLDAFNADKPFDRFLQEQLAGDLLPADSPAERDALRIATGFLALGPKLLDGKDLDVLLMEQVDEQLDTLGRGILGLTLSCARCHDHKFDPIPTADYYALAGIFRSTETLHGYGSKGVRARYNLHTDPIPIGDRTDLAPAALAHQHELIRLSTDYYNGRANRYVAMSRLTEARMRRGEPGADPAQREAEIARLEAEVADWDARINRAEAARQALMDAPPPQPDWAMGVRDRPEPVDCRIHLRGETTNLGDVAPRGMLRVVVAPGAALPGPRQSGRLELAEWLTRRDHPLTARVAVNRVWLHLFGRGLVTTLDDFGVNGARPSHPELLDHLAVRFMDDGWSIKRLLRYVVTSRTYRLAGGTSGEPQFAAQCERDPENVFLWRMPPRRLEAEILRDAIRAVAGTLDPARPAPHQEFLARLNAYREDEYLAYRQPFTPADIDLAHRSVYLPVVRGVLPESFQLFDFAPPERSEPRRDESVVPAQALYMLNDPWILEQARAAARRLLAEAAASDAARIEQLYRLAYARAPTAAESARVLAYLASDEGGDAAHEARWTNVCQAVLASAEFRYVR